MKILPVGDEFVPCGRTEKQGEVNWRFSPFCGRV